MAPPLDMLTAPGEARVAGERLGAEAAPAAGDESSANSTATTPIVKSTRPRCELKYPLAGVCHESLQRDLLKFMDHDRYARASAGRYTVRSLYFDTPNLRFYFDKLEGNSCRLKARIRRYESADGLLSPWFFEIKRKYHNACLKPPRLPFADDILREHLDEHGSIRLNELLTKIKAGQAAAELWALPVQASVLVTYERQAFVDRHGSRLRVTLDCDYRARFTGHPYTPLRPWDQIAFPGVMEIKFERTIPSWLEIIVRKHRMQLASTSKYGEGVEAAFPLRAVPHARAALDEGLPATTLWFLRAFGS